MSSGTETPIPHVAALDAAAKAKPRRRIAVVLHSRERGGLEGLALRLAGNWREAGADVVLITVARSNDPLPLPEGVHDVSLDHPMPAGSALLRFWQLRQTASRLRALLQDIQPDVLVSHGDRTNALTLYAHRKLPGRRVIAEHNDVRHHQIGRFWQVMRALTYPLAHRIIGVSAGVIAGMPEPWQIKAEVIHNPVPLLARPEDIVPDPDRIVGLGRLAHQKGFDQLIEAFAMIASALPATQLVIHGEGPERTALAAQITRLGLDARVHLPGRTADPVRALAQAGLFVFPSRYEGFGLALGEAMSLGLPVIAADCDSGPRELIRHGENGWLVPPHDAAALARAMAELLLDQATAARLGQAARGISHDFSEARFLAAWRAVVFDA